MMPGHCFTIEVNTLSTVISRTLTSSKPCLIQGSNPRGWIFPDGWTASTEVELPIRRPQFHPYLSELELRPKCTEGTYDSDHRRWCGGHHSGLTQTAGSVVTAVLIKLPPKSPCRRPGWAPLRILLTFGSTVISCVLDTRIVES
jgi:hypothetical protein